MKKVLDLLRESTLFHMETSISNPPYLYLSFLLFMFDIATIANEHFWHVHGEVLRRNAPLAKSSRLSERGSLVNVQQGAG